MMASTATTARRLAVVTGANQGIGYEIAKALALSPNNVHVILTARDANKGQAAVNSINAYAREHSHGQHQPASPLVSQPPSVEFYQLDVRDQGSIDRFSTHIGTVHGGRVDILVNNAGLAFKGDTFGADEARATIDTNFYGTIRVTEALLPYLRAAASAAPASRGARVINICSQAGRLGQVSPQLQARFQDADASVASLSRLVRACVRVCANVPCCGVAPSACLRAVIGVFIETHIDTHTHTCSNQPGLTLKRGVPGCADGSASSLSARRRMRAYGFLSTFADGGVHCWHQRRELPTEGLAAQHVRD